jgi:hypothetical protein
MQRLEKIPGDLTRWAEFPIEQRVEVWNKMKDHGPHIIKALNTVLVMCARLMKSILCLLKTPQSSSQSSSQFYAPLGTCLELECQGKFDDNFKHLEDVQERFLDFYCRRELICKTMLRFFQHPQIHHIYANELTLKRVRVVHLAPLRKYPQLTKLLTFRSGSF